MTELATQTLHTVAREIGSSLNEGRIALEAHGREARLNEMLRRCQHELHQVQGVLCVLRSMAPRCWLRRWSRSRAYLIGLGVERKNQDEALDALMRAMVQLPGYLERVLAGGRDLALVLLPLLNDLRAVRGSALLSEGTLLLLNLKSDRQAQPAAPAPGESPLSVGQWGRRLRARFQTGLVRLDPARNASEQNLEIMGAVATRLEQVATTQPVFQLWWVVGALIESLREIGNDSSISVKRLLGLADRGNETHVRSRAKRAMRSTSGRTAQQPALLHCALHQFGSARIGGPRLFPIEQRCCRSMSRSNRNARNACRRPPSS